MRRFLTALGCGLAIGMLGGAAPVGPRIPPMPQAAAVAGPSTPAAGVHALTAQDLEPWLDGFFPYALQRADIAGAVVVVVKDGQVLLAKGYGYADVARKKPIDPDATLFRPGSISKLFTWTAVMQLVEQGRLDLDRDVNDYLDFRIPPRDGRPITLRNLMTHTPGFEEHGKALFVSDPKKLMTLAQWERTQLPRRIFPPGEVPAYSNYGASTAGYIVQRVSGEPFEQYVERHIFAPLGMTHATFRQPLPAGLAPDMAQSYRLGSGDPKPFEFVNGAPAGGLAASGGDLAKFMIAFMNEGQGTQGRILKPETVRLMLSPAFQEAPPLNGMSLGWFMDDRNGHRLRGHGGDLQYHHSQLDILPDDHVALFVSLDSAGQGPSSEAIRNALYRGFMDRYFPAPVPDEPALPSARADGAKIAGLYELSRRSETTPLALQRLLQQLRVSVDDKGLVAAPMMDKLFGTPPRKWREVAPMVWREQGGKSRLAALMKDGKVVALTTDDIPQFAVLQPVPPSWRMSWRMPVLTLSLAVLLAFVLTWPVAAIARRTYGQRFALTGRAAMLYRAARGAALLDIAFVLAWLGTFSTVGSDISRANASLDPVLRADQALGVLGLLGLVFVAWNLVEVWRGKDRGWWAKVASLLLFLACLFVDWTLFDIHAFNLSLAY
jgi:CubicO group peptidase (beta-lactamase class C family)